MRASERVISKTRMTEWVRGFRWKDVRDGLAERPALLDVRDEKGRNWLHLCCGVDPRARRLTPADGVKTLDALLAAGLDIDREAFVEGDWKATPLWYAIARGENLVSARHLLELGADPNHCLWAAGFRDDVRAIRLLASHGAEIDPVTENETPFLGAIKSSHFRAAAVLLELGADVDFQDTRGRTALHYMLKKDSDLKHFRTLIRHGARGDLPDDEGVTAADVMSRKRTPGFQKLAARLHTA
jgi:hypothetical protein